MIVSPNPFHATQMPQMDEKNQKLQIVAQEVLHKFEKEMIFPVDAVTIILNIFSSICSSQGYSEELFKQICEDCMKYYPEYIETVRQKRLSDAQM